MTMSTTNSELKITEKIEEIERDGSSPTEFKDMASVKEVASSAPSLCQNDANITNDYNSMRQLTRDLEKASGFIAADTQPEGGTQAWVTGMGA